MKKSDYDKILEFANVGGGLMPANENASELLDTLSKGEIVPMKEITARDIKFHRCYFALLKFIHGYMPSAFIKKIPEGKFYYFLKHLKGEYEVIFTFQDGTQMVEYESISFGRMSQKSFEEYIKLQLPWIYENVIGEYYEGDMYTGIIETIEDEFKKFLSKL